MLEEDPEIDEEEDEEMESEEMETLVETEVTI